MSTAALTTGATTLASKGVSPPLETGKTAEFHWFDVTTIAAYFIAVLLLGLWTTFRPRDTQINYFLAGKSMTWLPIGASMFATNVGPLMFIGVAGQAAASGIACTIYEWHGVFMLVLLGWVFVPVYIASGSFTVPDYLTRRYGSNSLRGILSAVTLFQLWFTGIPTDLYAGAFFVEQMLGWNIYLSVILLLLITALYTVVGGLAAVMYTDALQMAIFAISCTTLFVLTMVRIGGFDALWHRYMHSYTNYTAVNNITCGYPREDALHMFRAWNADLPWPGMTFGLTSMALWFFCTNQVIVQRTLAAKNMTHAKAGTILAAYLKLLPFILFVVPGMAARVLFTDEIACSDAEVCKAYCNNPDGCSNKAYTRLVLEILPVGIRGLMVAAMLAALMSSLSSVFNSASTLFTMDLYKFCRPRASENELLIAGRVFVIILITSSVGFVPVIQLVQGGQLWSYIQMVASCITPPLCVVFLLGIFWTRATETGAHCAIGVGLIFGAIRFALEVAFKAPSCGDPLPKEPPFNAAMRWFIINVPFLNYAVILTLISLTAGIIGSLCSTPRTRKQLARVTWWTRNDEYIADLDKTEVEGYVEYIEHEKARAMSGLSDKLDDLHASSNANTTKAEPNVDSFEIDENFVTEDVPLPKRLLRKLGNWVCGFRDEADKAPELTEQEKALAQKEMVSIEEDPFWRWFMNINAVIAIIVAITLWGIFA